MDRPAPVPANDPVPAAVQAFLDAHGIPAEAPILAGFSGGSKGGKI